MVGWEWAAHLRDGGVGFSFDHSESPSPLQTWVHPWSPHGPPHSHYTFSWPTISDAFIFWCLHLDLHHSLLYWATGWKIQPQSLSQHLCMFRGTSNSTYPSGGSTSFLVPFWTPFLWGLMLLSLPRCSAKTPSHPTMRGGFIEGLFLAILRFWMDIHVGVPAFSLPSAPSTISGLGLLPFVPILAEGHAKMVH